jgi:hypothetical protein
MAERIESAGTIHHPLAVTRTELVWEGKYDSARNRVAPLRVALPFQTVETVNESAAARLHTQELFAQHRQTEWRNRLIWGDKKYVLPSLLAEFAGKVNLIYIDPPFDTGADFSSPPACRIVLATTKTTRPRSPKNRASLSIKPTATPGGTGWIPTCDGFMKPPCCSTNCSTKTEASTFIWIGIAATMQRLFWMRFSDRAIS